jgi:hypothetical protein
LPQIRVIKFSGYSVPGYEDTILRSWQGHDGKSVGSVDFAVEGCEEHAIV